MRTGGFPESVGFIESGESYAYEYLKTVSRYIDTLVESYLFYKVNRYDIKGKQHLATQEKYYLVDLGLRYALLGKELSADAGHLL
jgi:hypothetical protein